MQMMFRSGTLAATKTLATLALAAVLAACGATPGARDDGRGAEALYAEAREALAARSYERAIAVLERLEGRAAGTLLAQQAQLDLAYARWRAGERAQAIVGLDRFIRLHPSSPALDYALYLRGRVNFVDELGLFGNFAGQRLAERDQQAAREAHESFRQLVEMFPQSRYAEDARIRMDFIVNQLAEGEVLVARYYFRRGAYLAAAKRAQFAIREYPQTPASEEALFLLVRSYERLGLTTLRDDAERVLRANFPQSRWLRDGEAAAQRPWWRLW